MTARLTASAKHRHNGAYAADNGNRCPHCGQRMRQRKDLILELARVSGVDPAVMQTMSMGALEGLLAAWPKGTFPGDIVTRRVKLLPAAKGTP